MLAASYYANVSHVRRGHKQRLDLKENVNELQ